MCSNLDVALSAHAADATLFECTEVLVLRRERVRGDDFLLNHRVQLCGLQDLWPEYNMRCGTAVVFNPLATEKQYHVLLDAAGGEDRRLVAVSLDFLHIELG